MTDAVISLFSGAGGLSLGFAQAGLKPAFAFDIEPAACQTYAMNLGLEPQCGDLVSEFRRVIQALRAWPRPLAIIGGPPCQGFSSAGMKQTADPRNRLIFAYLEIVAEIRPQWFLFENVEGLLTSNRGNSVAELMRRFIGLGYHVRLEKVNFAVYGVPQSRKRVIIIGNNRGLEFGFPKRIYSFEAGKHYYRDLLPRGPTLADAIAGLGPIAGDSKTRAPYGTDSPLNEFDELMRTRNHSGTVSLHYCKVRQQDRELYSRLKAGQTMKDLPEDLWPPSFRRRAFRRVMDGTPTERRGGAPSGLKRLRGDRSSLTITSATTREFIHPFEDRALTLREAARIQSFPDSFEFSGNEHQIAVQIGNAFPPIAAEVFARHLVAVADQSEGVRSRIKFFSTGRLVGYQLTESTGMSPALEDTDSLLRRLAVDQIQMHLE